MYGLDSIVVLISSLFFRSPCGVGAVELIAIHPKNKQQDDEQQEKELHDDAPGMYLQTRFTRKKGLLSQGRDGVESAGGYSHCCPLVAFLRCGPFSRSIHESFAANPP